VNGIEDDEKESRTPSGEKIIHTTVEDIF